MARQQQGKRGIPAGVKVAAGIGFALGVASYGHGAHAARPQVADAMAAPSPPAADGGAIPLPADGSRTAWADALLTGADCPLTSSDVAAIVIWEVAEGGGFGNQASFNPLNINPGSADWPGHPADGAWAFPSAADGLRETVVYLHMSNFAGILAALRRGDSEHAVLLAIVRSPWASRHYGGNQVMQDALAST